jgi:hypothetical protein
MTSVFLNPGVKHLCGAAYAPALALVLGYYSVHTSPQTLIAGERRIDEIRTRLQREGRL